MSLVWRSQMSTGLIWQDEQHKEIFRRIDMLLEAIELNKGASVVKELITFLKSYSLKHFADEEAYMDSHGCRTCVRHKECHEEFKTHLNEIITLYEHQGASTMVVLRLQTWLRDWLISHIISMDKEMVLTSVADALGRGADVETTALKK
ncbi:MAG: hemerythrin family protein [bacterium]|nr:hemerythrin family protein [bacterium]